MYIILYRSVYDADDQEARSAMHLASAYAGVGFGNAGVHLAYVFLLVISDFRKVHALVWLQAWYVLPNFRPCQDIYSRRV